MIKPYCFKRSRWLDNDQYFFRVCNTIPRLPRLDIIIWPKESSGLIGSYKMIETGVGSGMSFEVRLETILSAWSGVR